MTRQAMWEPCSPCGAVCHAVLDSMVRVDKASGDKVEIFYVHAPCDVLESRGLSKNPLPYKISCCLRLQ
jgi:hypothetical protein